MRLKGQKSQNAMSNRSLDRSESDTRNGDLLNGSSASCSSASAIGTQDDLDNAIDSADDEIDVGTNADSIEYNGNSANTSAALSGINNDHQFGIFTNQSLNYSSSMHSNQQSSQSGSITDADRKRAHHNALERKRRDHIKDSFHTLRDAIPNIKGEKTSRAQILKAATDYIRHMRTRNIDYQNDIEIIKKQNNDIENQIKQLEKAKQTASHLLRQQQSNQNDPLNDGDISDDLDDYKFDIHDNKASLAAIVAAVTSTAAVATSTVCGQQHQQQPMTTTSSTKQINYSNILNQKVVQATSTSSPSSSSSASSSSYSSPSSSSATTTATPIKLNYSNLINQKLLTTTTMSGNQKVVTTMSTPTTHAKFNYPNVINQQQQHK